jgi:hypothetical protein
MFEKEIILKEQLAACCRFQCSPARKLPGQRGTLDVQAFKGKSERDQGQPIGLHHTLTPSPGFIERAKRAGPGCSTQLEIKMAQHN